MEQEANMTSIATPRRWRASLTAATILAGFAMPMTALAQAGAQWPTERGDPQGTGYSSLSEINDSNVGSLVEDFSIPTNAFRNHEGAPLVVKNIMYFTTPFATANSELQMQYLYAVDLTKKGKVLWVFNPNADPGSRAQACCDLDNRGPAYVSQAEGAPNADGEIIFNTLDGNIIGVDAITGVQNWKTKLADKSIGETLTGAPIVADGIAMVGNSGAEDGVRGAVYGVNVTTGALVWKAYNTGPDADVLIGANFHAYYGKDQGTDLGVTSWNGGNWWQQGGATAWGYKTYDPKTDLFYYGTGNAEPWLSAARGGTGDAKWAATIFARRPKTGEAIWAYQVSPNDNWDYDSIAESVVADIPVNGVQRHVVFHVDKNGYGYTLDAATGQVLQYGNVSAAGGGIINWATGIDLKTGAPQVVKSHVIKKFGPSFGIGGDNGNCPGPGGVKDPEPISFSYQTGLFYIPAHNGCISEMAQGANWIVGVPYTGFTTIPNHTITSPGSPGSLVAWDAGTGQPVWTVNEPYPLWSGVLTTAGNLVVYGTLSNGTDTNNTPTVKILNAKTGALLWSTALECNTVGSPMSFTGADGHQRIAIFTGTGSTGNAGTGACPNLNPYNPAKVVPQRDTSLTSTWLHQELKVPKTAFTETATSGYVHVFKLP